MRLPSGVGWPGTSPAFKKASLATRARVRPGRLGPPRSTAISERDNFLAAASPRDATRQEAGRQCKSTSDAAPEPPEEGGTGLKGTGLRKGTRTRGGGVQGRSTCGVQLLPLCAYCYVFDVSSCL